MLSHVKYRYCIFEQIEKKSKYYLGTPMLKENLSEYKLSDKNIQYTNLLGFGVYTLTPYAPPYKLHNFYI